MILSSIIKDLMNSDLRGGRYNNPNETGFDLCKYDKN